MTIHNKIERVLAVISLCLIFSLAVYFVGHVLLVNPVLCFFGLMACGLFWLVVKVDEWYPKSS
jgi:hypothetical protein